MKEKKVTVNENNNTIHITVHRIDVAADSDTDGASLDGVPAVAEDQYESACED